MPESKAGSDISGKKSKYLVAGILACIALAALFLRLYDIGGHDMATDDVLYSFRSIGYIDYVAATNLQSTPMTWFPEPRWWQRLSFHDHPPFVFAVQWLFFKIGGVNAATARLPFALAGALAVFFIFFLAKNLFGAPAGFFAAIALAISNYAIWISRIGFLDGFLVLWIILSLYFFAKAEKRPIHYLWWGCFSALGIMTKYTFLFMLPVFLIIPIIFRRKAFKEKFFYFGIIAFLLIISPVIIYNFMMWQARGHFDASLSSMLGQSPEDFMILARETNKNLNIFSAVKNILADNFSAGFQVLIISGLILFFYKIWRAGGKERYAAVLLGSFFATISLSLVGGGNNFGVIMLPFTGLVIGYLVSWLRQKFQGWQKNTIMVLVILVGIWEIFTAIQSQLIKKPPINNRFLVSKNSLLSFRGGYNELENEVNQFYKNFAGQPIANQYSKSPQLAQYESGIIDQLLESRKNLPPYQHLLVYDDRVAWFQSTWTFERRVLYEAAPIDKLSQFLGNMLKKGAGFYTRFGLKDVTIITPTENVQQNKIINNRDAIESFTGQLEKIAKPIDEIRGPDGKVLFKVFRLELEKIVIK